MTPFCKRIGNIFFSPRGGTWGLKLQWFDSEWKTLSDCCYRLFSKNFTNTRYFCLKNLNFLQKYFCSYIWGNGRREIKLLDRKQKILTQYFRCFFVFFSKKLFLDNKMRSKYHQRSSENILDQKILFSAQNLDLPSQNVELFRDASQYYGTRSILGIRGRRTILL